MPKRDAKLVSIQYLRAAGAILVVLSHIDQNSFIVGQSGVDLFFIVSGFVMMLVSDRERSPGQFMLARAARIVPLYWAVTLVIAILGHVPAERVIPSLLFWPASRYPVVMQGWSLNLEMAYYALFAITLPWSKPWRLRILAAALCLLCIAAPVLLPPSAPLEHLSSPLGFEFLIGAALYEAWCRGAVPTGAGAPSLLAAGVAALIMTSLLGDVPQGWLRVVAWGMPALAIAKGMLGLERSGRLPRMPLAVCLGDASYSIYLTHVVVLSFVAAPLLRLWAPAAVPLIVVLTSVAGWAVYRGFEQPVMRLSKVILRTDRVSRASTRAVQLRPGRIAPSMSDS